MNASPSSLLPFSPTGFFSLTIIALLILLIGLYLYFSKRLTKQKEVFNAQLQKEKEIEHNKTLLLSNMSDDMYELTQNLVNPEEKKDEALEKEILHSANNLRELLKIQANKIEIYKEKFVFSHMLEDVSTYLASNFKQRNTEVVFNIHENVPRYLTGDVIHFSRIINNILEFAIQSTPQGKVTLEITCDKPLSNDIILNVTIKDSAKGLGEDTFKKLFELNYNDKKKEQWGFGLYIAKKLTLAIGGTIEAHSVMASGNVFSLQIPMQLNEDSTLKEFNALKEGLAPRKILIYSEKAATGNSLKKLFNYFYEEVELATRIQLDKRLINLLDFDIIVLEDIFFNTSNNAYLKSIKESKDVYIVGLSSIFSSNAHEDNVLIDSYLKTPSNLERIVTLIQSLDTSKPEVEAIEEEIVHEEKNDGKLLVYKEPIKESQNIDLDCFTYFKGSRLLIVEDNLINQKIIVSVLKKSGIEIEIANNGQEALDILFVEQKMFDIVLMDISMPVMDGLIATQHIRERTAYDKMPIITFTAFAMGSEIEQMFDAGCNAYLTKPLNIKKLYHAFSMFLSPSHREVSLHKTIEIEGLDIEVGIYNADESEVLYKETLKEFILVYKDMSESIPKWINEKRYERVKLACNEIDGILDAIGAYEMKALVNDMQKHFLYSNEEFLDQYSRLYPEKFNNLIEAIEHYLHS